jgi:hypothetical protein
MRSLAGHLARHEGHRLAAVHVDAERGRGGGDADLPAVAQPRVYRRRPRRRVANDAVRQDVGPRTVGEPSGTGCGIRPAEVVGVGQSAREPHPAQDVTRERHEFQRFDPASVVQLRERHPRHLEQTCHLGGIEPPTRTPAGIVGDTHVLDEQAVLVIDQQQPCGSTVTFGRDELGVEERPGRTHPSGSGRCRGPGAALTRCRRRRGRRGRRGRPR